MAPLTKEQLLKDKQTHDPNSITSLSLDHKALSDVSCLGEFQNLERLDLTFNSLTSLEGLKSCVNLKWLSVVQNKLQTLKGIEGLTRLTVLNAGKNKLRSMEEVRPLVNLRALILNDNEIVSISGLDQMKDLNTLVLSRNPITEIGNSLVKLKSITKLSASNCQIQAIESSLKSCSELKELRLAHNDIKSLPAELSYNKKLQNLDLGNNLITRWSDLKALESLVSLKNLNLQGNPIAEKDKLAKKVKKLVPNLHIFNARPLDKIINKEMGGTYKDENPKEEKKNPKFEVLDQKQDTNLNNAKGLDAEKELKKKRKKGNDKVSGDVQVEEGNDIVVEKEKKKKKSKGEPENDNLKKEVYVHKDGNTLEEKPKKKKSEKRSELDIIDDSGTSFAELISTDVAGPEDDGKRNMFNGAGQDMKPASGVVTYPVKKKKKKHGSGPELKLSPVVEIGMGGPSTWDDE